MFYFTFIQTVPRIILLIIIFIIIACSSGNKQIPPSTTNTEQVVPIPSPAEEPPSHEATVEHIDIMILETFPVQINIIASGHLPDDCTTIDQITEERNGDVFTVKIITTRQTDKVCTTMLKPFEEVIPLTVTDLAAGIYTVKVNDKTDIFELGVDNIVP